MDLLAKEWRSRLTLQALFVRHMPILAHLTLENCLLTQVCPLVLGLAHRCRSGSCTIDATKSNKKSEPCTLMS